MVLARKELYLSRIERIAKEVCVDADLLAAIIEVESEWNPWAIRLEPTVRYSNSTERFAKENGVTEETELMLQHCSLGLGQIMGASARDLGFEGPLLSLCDADIGILWSAMFLKSKCKRYIYKDDQIAAYNAGSPRRKPNGLYFNQDYVDKVNKILERDHGKAS